MRLNQYLAHCGICSRRKADEYIEAARVKVNDKIIREMGFQIDPYHDTVYFDDTLVEPESKLVYILLNKPKQIVTTVSDEHERATVLELLTDIKERVYPVGRLDYMTSGILLLTNDGDLTHKLSHPSYEVKKVYHCKIDKVLSKEELDHLRFGVEIEGSKTASCEVKVLSTESDSMKMEIIIHEGKNRQIRKMMEFFNADVKYLDRIEYGGLNYSGLKVGEYRHLDAKELAHLKHITTKKSKRL
jgi:23S rRNA pseudouridine2605 synthase